MSLFSKSSQPYVEPDTPFGGFVPESGVPAVTAPHLLVSAVSGAGKTRRVLGPAILMWRGPVVAVSSKPDLVDLCLEQRLAWNGYDRTYLLDLSGEVPDEVVPEGVHRVIVDPTALIRNDDDALDMASVLMQAGAAGAGGGNNSGSGDAFWENISTGPLAALLRATGDDGISWCREAVGRIEPGGEDDDEGAEPDLDVPCWANAIARLEDESPMLAAELFSASQLDGKMRDSVMVTMKSAVAPWLRSTVAGRGGEIAFKPEMLSHPNSTLFMIAPATGVAAGAAVAVVDFITKRWRANQTEPVKLPRLLMVVDELANTMGGWAKLPTVVTESRAMGIHLLVAVQGTSQLAQRYGEQGMTILRDTFPAILCLVGAPEREILEKAAFWQGQSERQKISTDHLGRQSQSSEKTDTITATDLLPRSKNEGRLLRGSRPGVPVDAVNEAGLLVTLVDISQIQFEVKK